MAFLAPIAVSAAPKILKLLAPFAGLILIASVGFSCAEFYEHKVPWGLYHKLASARHDRDAWKAASTANRNLAIGWAKSFGTSEGRRAVEHKTAVAAVNADAIACSARVAAARRSSAAIAALLSKEPAHDPQGCPVRALIDAGGLRDALATSGAGRP